MSCEGLKGVKLAQCKKRYERNAAAGLKRTGKTSSQRVAERKADFLKKMFTRDSIADAKKRKKFSEIIYADGKTLYGKTVSKKPKKKEE
jgi:hypothetical protein